MKTFKQKPCRECGVLFMPTAPCSLYCSDNCASIVASRVNKEKLARYRAKNGALVGVGSGNAQGIGELHHSYKNGIKNFSNKKLESMTVHKCERCDLDLTSYIHTNKYKWTVHHKDHDRANNNIDNLELLCKRCHQLEHKCYDNFHKV